MLRSILSDYKDYIIKNTYASDWILLLSIILTGGFHEFTACFIGVVIAAFLTVRIIKNMEFTINISFVSISVLLISFGYLITGLYGIDRGESFIGFIRFLPVVLYMLLLMQDDRYYNVVNRLPYIAFGTGIVSALLMLIPALQSFFVVSGRMAGFFQYPNSFALFLLVGELVMLTNDDRRKKDYVIIIALIVMILLTGSRIVFVLTILSNIITILILINRRNDNRINNNGRKNIIWVIIAVAVLLIILTLLIISHNSVLQRIFDLSLKESTFVGRILYYYDALKILRRYPFGTGFMGYYYLQRSVQTGVYSNKYVHNDFLQILMDVGWIPGLLFITAVGRALVKGFIREKNNLRNNMILFVMCIHIFFDFDLQFISMFFILLLFLKDDRSKTVVIKERLELPVIVTGLSIAVSAYFFVALMFSYLNKPSIAHAMYPYDTQNNIKLMLSYNDAQEQNKAADKIIVQNENVPVAYSAKARYAFSKGQFDDLMMYKNKIFDIAPFEYDEYEEYCSMLIGGISIYTESGDLYSVDVCKDELIKTADRLTKLNDRLSPLGKMINVQPRTQLPDSIVSFIDNISGDKAYGQSSMEQALQDEGALCIYDNDGNICAVTHTRDFTGNDYLRDNCKSYMDIVMQEAAQVIMDKDGINEASVYKMLLNDEYTINTYLDSSVIENINDIYAKSSISGYPLGCAMTDLTGGLVAVYSSNVSDDYAVSDHLPYSTLKPLSVYAPAIDNNTAYWSKQYEDSPYKKVYDSYGTESDWPENSTGIYSNKNVTLSEGVKESLNTVSVKCLMDYGISNSLEFLEDRFDIDLEFEKSKCESEGEEEIIGNLAMGFLNKGVSAVDMAGYYQIFANGGKYYKPMTISTIKDKEGNIIYERKADYSQVIQDTTAEIMNNLLRGVVNGGTGAEAQLADIIAGGKTGTGVVNNDHWFVGFVPQYSLAVWHGGGDSNNYAPRLFADIFNSMDLDERITYPETGHVISQIYCIDSGKLAASKCSGIDIGYYQDTSDIGVCDIHK